MNNRLMILYFILLIFLMILIFILIIIYKNSDINSKKRVICKYALLIVFINIFLITQTALIVASLLEILN